MNQQSYVHIRLRRDTAQNWTNNNPILKIGEPGLETDTRKLKFGDGTTVWNNLPYSGVDVNDNLLLENIDDRVANLIKAGSNISVNYNDSSNELIISATGLQLSGDYATLVNGKIPAIQLPSYVDDVLEFNNLASFPSSGEGDKIYVTKDSNKTYRWSGSAYIEISASPGSTDAVPEGSVNKYYTDARASAASPVQSVAGKTGVVTLTKNDVGLDNVDNISDINKPISNATQIALNNKSDITHNHNTLYRKIQTITLGFTVPSPITAEKNTEYVFSIYGLVGPYIKGNFVINDPVSASPGDSYVVYKPTSTMHNVVIGDITYSSSSSFYIYRTYTLVGTTFSWQTTFYSPVQSVAGKTGVVTLGKSDVGLGNVDNTSDANKPVSTAQQTALDLKAPIANPTFTGTVNGITKGMVGLGNVDNTSDANKPISTATQTALNGKASLVDGKVPAAQLPSYVDDVLEYANLASLPVTGESGKIYVALDSNKVYRWGGSSYLEISPSPGSTDSVAEGSTNLYFTNSRASAAAPVQSVAGKIGTVTLSKGDVELSNVDNTSDIDKPVSSATQTALNAKANKTDIYNAAVPWTANHTLADGTRYLAGDLVYVDGKIYRAKFDNESLTVTNTTYWEDLGSGYRLNIDGRDIPNIPYPVTSVNGLIGAVTIDSANTGDITFSDVKIIGAGTASGDGLNNGTLELVPDNDLYANHQYLVIDPTTPNHIHIRAGGPQDGSNAELILGGEYANVKVIDTGHQVTVAADAGFKTISIVPAGYSEQLFVPGQFYVYYYGETTTGISAGATVTINGVLHTVTFVNILPEQGWEWIALDPPTNFDTIPYFTSTTLTFTQPSIPLNWTFGNDGNLNIPGNIVLDNGTSVAVGSYDNNTGGQNGISLNCSVGYELNWQGGHLRSSEIGNSSVTQPLFVDSPIQIPGTGVSNMTVSASGLTFPDGTSQSSAATGGGGLSDSNRYIICKAGDDILAKYSAAKLLTPAGSALSSTNRAYLIVMPGVYPLSAQWEIDAEFVDVIGLGSTSTPLDRGCNVSVTVTGYDINVSANNVRIKGVGTTSDRAFKIDGDKPLQVFEECIGGVHEVAIDEFTTLYYYSFGGSGTASGSFINCVGGDSSFGGSGTASGSFINCVGGDSSFGSYVNASGSFVNCSGGYYSFGGGYGVTASGSFVNCSGGYSSFGGNGGTASGSFKDCSGGYSSFGGNGGTASGSFKDCSGGDYSFGGSGTASGKFLYCTLTTGTFPTLSGTGKYRLCIDGDYNVINADAP